MNERIYELAVQAKIQMVSEPRLQEFAELIVAECINMIEAEAKNADEDSVHGMRNAAGLLGRAFITLQS